MNEKICEQHFLTLFLAFYQKADGQLSPYTVWGLLTFVRNFGAESTSLPLAQLAKVMGIQVKKLRVVLNELEQQGILMVSFPESGKRARVRHLKLRLAYVDAVIESCDWLENKNKRQGRDIPLLQLVKILFIKSDELSISNLPQNLELNYGLDYRSYLVLLRLLYGADSFGIVIGYGIGEIERATGLSKQAIYRSIQQLKLFGFIRCQANGAIRNSFIQTESPIYALNLSHKFWGDAAIYGKFYILKYPQPHVFEVQKVASIFTLFDQNNDLLQNVGNANSKASLDVLKYKNNYLLHDPLCWMKPIISSPRTHVGYADYVVVQKQEMMKLFDHYFELKRLHPENPLSITFNLKQHENILEDGDSLDNLEFNKQNKLNGMHNRLGLFQSLLEQWCCQIYSQNSQVFKSLRDANQVAVDDVDFDRLGSVDFLYPYALHAGYTQIIKEDVTLKNKPDKIESMITFRLKTEQARVYQFLMALMNLIAYNQIYFFQQCLKTSSDIGQKLNAAKTSLEWKLISAKERVIPFRILPRYFNQNTYSCFFVPDQHAKADEYFLSELEFQKPLQDGASFDFPVQHMTKISPTIEELKSYGILHHRYLSSFE